MTARKAACVAWFLVGLIGLLCILRCGGGA